MIIVDLRISIRSTRLCLAQDRFSDFDFIFKPSPVRWTDAATLLIDLGSLSLNHVGLF